MTTRRDFLKALGVGAVVAALPALPTPKSKNKSAGLDKPTYPRTVVATAESRWDDTTINVYGHERLRPNDVILNVRTREQILVTNIAYGRLTAIRGLGGFPVTIEGGDILLVTSSGLEV
jgi:hypothetical protein